jgi:hypothetical protein
MLLVPLLPDLLAESYVRRIRTKSFGLQRNDGE